MTLELMPLRSMPRRRLSLAAGRVRALVCDADGTLFPVPGPAARPDPDALGALAVLGQRFVMTLVSPAPADEVEQRLAACGLSPRFPAAHRVAASSSEAGYRTAVAAATPACLPDETVAVVATPAAARFAAGAGLTAVGNMQYVAPHDRPERNRELLDAGAALVVTSWEHLLVTLLD